MKLFLRLVCVIGFPSRSPTVMPWHRMVARNEPRSLMMSPYSSDVLDDFIVLEALQRRQLALPGPYSFGGCQTLVFELHGGLGTEVNVGPRTLRCHSGILSCPGRKKSCDAHGNSYNSSPWLRRMRARRKTCSASARPGRCPRMSIVTLRHGG